GLRPGGDGVGDPQLGGDGQGHRDPLAEDHLRHDRLWRRRSGVSHSIPLLEVVRALGNYRPAGRSRRVPRLHLARPGPRHSACPLYRSITSARPTNSAAPPWSAYIPSAIFMSPRTCSGWTTISCHTSMVAATNNSASSPARSSRN